MRERETYRGHVTVHCDIEGAREKERESVCERVRAHERERERERERKETERETYRGHFTVHCDIEGALLIVAVRIRMNKSRTQRMNVSRTGWWWCSSNCCSENTHA